MVGSLLDDVMGVDRRDLVAASRRRKFSRNDTIFYEGDPGASLHVVVKGYVAIRTTTDLGEVVTLTVLGPGESFGELALLTSEAIRTASAVALEAVETLSWQRAKVEELRARSHEFDGFLLEILAGQVQREDLASMAGTTRPSANRALKDVEADGIVALRRGRIEVLDRAGLAQRAKNGR